MLPGPYLEGHGHLESRVVSPIIYMIILVIPINNLFTKSPLTLSTEPTFSGSEGLLEDVAPAALEEALIEVWPGTFSCPSSLLITPTQPYTIEMPIFFSIIPVNNPNIARM